MRPRCLTRNAVIALASAVAAFAAVVTAGLLVWQTPTTVSNQAVLQLLGFWQSDVLDFFETLAFLNVLDPQQTYHFFESMANYWVLHRKYIRTVRERKPIVWKQYSQLMSNYSPRSKSRQPPSLCSRVPILSLRLAKFSATAKNHISSSRALF
jgi:hypothetical protein